MKNTQTTKVIVPCRFSYLNAFEPKSIEGSAPKYSVSAIIPKSDKLTLDKINKAIEQAKQDGKDKWGGKIPANLKLPLRDGDLDREDDPNYANSFFINANSNSRPGVVDARLNPIIDSDELYSGCYGRVSITFYAFNSNGNKGIAAGLGNLQKLKDGEPLGGGRIKPEDEFEAEEDGDDMLL